MQQVVWLFLFVFAIYVDNLVVTSGTRSVNGFAGYTSSQGPMLGYFGAMATLEFHPFTNLRHSQVTSASISVETSKDTIQAGWEIDPDWYGDSKIHLFVYWTNDRGIEPGCINLNCTAFVPVNGAPMAPGDTLGPFMDMLKITLKIFKKKNDDDWWLYIGPDINNLTPLGFWPKSIFTTMADHATWIGWDGQTVSDLGKPSPPMGNGQWPGQHAAAIRDIRYVDTSGQGFVPQSWLQSLRARVSNNKCYNVSPLQGDMFYYGGQGGCTGF